MGITPAHAGKRDTTVWTCEPVRDHPRTCGEKFLQSPLCPLPSRITPAHAGKRRCKAAFCVWSWDHPRTCGEKCVLVLVCSFQIGSPPHMRGKVTTFDAGKLIPGITPAHAGKSIYFLVHRCARRDHPRTCGEKDVELKYPIPSLGSPPHMRGKVFAFMALLLCVRITPAHAGKSTLD